MMTFNCIKKLMLGSMTFLFALAAGISPVAAQTITFGTGSSQPPSYTESGLTVSAAAISGGHLHVEDRNLDGDTDLMCHSGAGGVSNNYTFDMGGAPFIVISLDFSGEAITPGGGIFPLGTNTFTSSTGATQNPTAPGTIIFPAAGWTGITSFSWSTTASAVIDNLVVVIDTDGDGVFDDEDECVDSDLSATVVILDCDSGVENQLFPNGCTISDLIAECAAEANNHGQFVRCVAHLTNDLKKAGLITGKEKGKIQSCAAKAKP